MRFRSRAVIALLFAAWAGSLVWRSAGSPADPAPLPSTRVVDEIDRDLAVYDAIEDSTGWRKQLYTLLLPEHHWWPALAVRQSRAAIDRLSGHLESLANSENAVDSVVLLPHYEDALRRYVAIYAALVGEDGESPELRRILDSRPGDSSSDWALLRFVMGLRTEASALPEDLGQAISFHGWAEDRLLSLAYAARDEGLRVRDIEERSQAANNRILRRTLALRSARLMIVFSGIGFLILGSVWAQGREALKSNASEATRLPAYGSLLGGIAVLLLQRETALLLYQHSGFGTYEVIARPVATAGGLLLATGVIRVAKPGFALLAGSSGSGQILHSWIAGFSIQFAGVALISFVSRALTDSEFWSYPAVLLDWERPRWEFSVLLLDVAVLGPIFEEVIFRGLGLFALCRIVGTVPGVFVSAIAFGEYHGGNVASIVAFAWSGLVWSVIALRTRGLLSSVLAHSSYNLSTLLPILRA